MLNDLATRHDVATDEREWCLEAWEGDLRRILTDAGRWVIGEVEGQRPGPLDAFCIVVDSGHCWFAWDVAPPGWLPGEALPARDGRAPSEFTQPDAPLPDDLLEALVDVSDTYAARLEMAEDGGRGDHAEEQLDAAVEDAAAAALAALGPDLARLDRTEGFVAHVLRFDGRWPEETARRTIPDDLVLQRFPGFAAGHRRDVALGELSSSGGPRALVTRLIEAYEVPPEQRIDVDLVIALDRELHGHADAARGPVLDAIDEYARRPQFTALGSRERTCLGVWSRAHALTGHLLVRVLPGLRGADAPDVERRLVDLGRWLHDNAEYVPADHEVVALGMNEALVARSLHTLWPGRYPAPEVSPTTNEVRNAAAFGFTASEQT